MKRPLGFLIPLLSVSAFAGVPDAGGRSEDQYRTVLSGMKDYRVEVNVSGYGTLQDGARRRSSLENVALKMLQAAGLSPRTPDFAEPALIYFECTVAANRTAVACGLFVRRRLTLANGSVIHAEWADPPVKLATAVQGAAPVLPPAAVEALLVSEVEDRVRLLIGSLANEPAP
jgi:hypothetical protein